MKRLASLLLVFIFFLSCNNHENVSQYADGASVGDNLTVENDNNHHECEELVESFSSYDEAKELVRDTEFKIEETINTSSSSWIRSAEYYSCDGEYGFLIIDTDYGDYIHSYFPYELWKKFKSASSFGSFYNEYIKGRYRMEI